jgi:CHASE3 domain sensor protein
MGNDVSQRKAGVLDSAQDWTKKRVFEPIENAIKVLTGRAAHDEIKKYILENEAINDALYTRLLEAESQIQRLRGWVRWLAATVAILAVVEIVHWVLR